MLLCANLQITKIELKLLLIPDRTEELYVYFRIFLVHDMPSHCCSLKFPDQDITLAEAGNFL